MKKILLTTAILANSVTIYGASAPTAKDFNELQRLISIANQDTALVQKVVNNHLSDALLNLELLGKEGQRFGVKEQDSNKIQTRFANLNLRRMLEHKYRQYKNSGQDFITKAESIRWLGNSLKGDSRYSERYLKLADKLEAVGLGLLSPEVVNLQDEVLNVDQYADDLIEDTMAFQGPKNAETGQIEPLTKEQALEAIAKDLSGKGTDRNSLYKRYVGDIKEYWDKDAATTYENEFKQVLKNKIDSNKQATPVAAEAKVEEKAEAQTAAPVASQGAGTTTSGMPAEELANLEQMTMDLLGKMSPEEQEAVQKEAEAMEKTLNGMTEEEKEAWLRQ